MGNHNSAVRLLITGNIIKSGYKGWLIRKAKIGNLNCWVRSRGEQKVEAILIGSYDVLEKTVKDVWKGPKKAVIFNVNEKWFNIKYNTKLSVEANNVHSDLSWSENTGRLIKNNLSYLESVNPKAQSPKTYRDEGFINSSTELKRVLEKKNIFNTYLERSNYVILPLEKVGFQGSQFHKVSKIVDIICNNKNLTKRIMQFYDISVPEGKVCTSLSDAKEIFSNGLPVTVKPVDGRQGQGVTVGIQTEDALKTAYYEAKKHHEQFIVEENIYGVDLRIMIIGEKASAVYMRIPANVVGDGISDVSRLIIKKNQSRSENPRLKHSLIIPEPYMHYFVKLQGYTFKSVIPEGEVLFLHLKANLSAGGDIIEVTKHVHCDLLRLAEKVASAVDLGNYCGVDMIVENIFDAMDRQNCSVIEVNSRAMLESIRFPLYGEPFDAAQALIDHLFPEDTSDAAYPLDSYCLSITGILDEEFILSAGNKAKEMDLKGNLRAVNTSVEGVLSGRRHHVMFYLDWLLDYRSKKGAMVDGLQINRTAEVPDSDFSIKAAVEAESDTKSFSGYNEFKTDELSVNTFHSSANQNLDLNLQLFIDEFKRHGYESKHLYEELIEIKKDDTTGITGMRHSSLFCDKVCEKLYPAKRILALNGLPVLRGVRFKGGGIKEALNYFEALSNMCILTDLHPNGYKMHMVKEQQEFKKIWKKAREKGTSYFLVEEHIKGWHLCIAVVDGVAVSALAIERVYIEGDSQSSIAELIEAKNSLRLQNPWYSSKPIDLDKHLLKRLDSAGFKPEDIPEEGKRIYLETEAGLEYGGETVNIEQVLAEGFKTKAEEAVKAIPGLELAYVNMIVPSPDVSPDWQRWAVTGIDTRPEVGIFHYPWKGKPFNITERVVADLCLTERTKWLRGLD